TWITLESIPRYSQLTKKKTKIKDGAALCSNDTNLIYAIKGGNCQEFWKYNIELNQWTELDTLPKGPSGKKIGSGASLCYLNGKVYLLKGNKTLEFWAYTPFVANTVININNSPVIKQSIHLKTNLGQEIETSTVKIYNISGQLVVDNAGIFNTQFLQNLKPGVYFIQTYLLSTKEPLTGRKLIILPK
ncbi:MAG: T9SS type A sorting domain-containing protein, partial [candidate division WOR-3 bacterium]|nr:T9SS type A sorting domain-containing protein [candidate division WOR-3 bacterium]